MVFLHGNSRARWHLWEFRQLQWPGWWIIAMNRYNLIPQEEKKFFKNVNFWTCDFMYVMLKPWLPGFLPCWSPSLGMWCFILVICTESELVWFSGLVNAPTLLLLPGVRDIWQGSAWMAMMLAVGGWLYRAPWGSSLPYWKDAAQWHHQGPCAFHLWFFSCLCIKCSMMLESFNGRKLKKSVKYL